MYIIDANVSIKYLYNFYIQNMEMYSYCKNIFIDLIPGI